MRRCVWLLLVLVSSSCAANPLGVLRPAAAIEVPSLHLAGEFSIPPLGRYPPGIGLIFGGISGLAPRDGGAELVGISDDRMGTRAYRFLVSGVGAAFEVAPFGIISFERPSPDLPLDPEGIALTRTGTLIVSSEGRGHEEPRAPPALVEYGAHGDFVRRLEVRDRYVPNPTGPLTQGVRSNRGFESLTIAPGWRRLFTATETALVQDGEPATFERSASVRLLEYVQRGDTYVPGREYVYDVEPVHKVPFAPGVNLNGLVELLALSDTELLALERSYVEVSGTGQGTNRIRLFRVSLAGASDVSGFDSLQQAPQAVPVGKTLLLDLSEVPGLSPELAVGLDNFEGMAFGPPLPDGRRSLILVSDDNFNAGQRTWFLLFAIGEASGGQRVE